MRTPELVELIPRVLRSTRDRPALIPLKWVPNTRPFEPVNKLLVPPFAAVELRAHPDSQSL